MPVPLSIMTRKEIEVLIARIMKEQKVRIMPRLRDRASHPFGLEKLAVTLPLHLQTPCIDYYRGEGKTVEQLRGT